VDARRFDPAASIAEAFLARYPENRLAREMRGSLLFRRGDAAEALAEHERLREEYAELSKTPNRLPLGYYRAVGNLARIRASRGDAREAEVLRVEWRRGLRGPAGPWLPAGLKADLAGPDGT
jgi:hypothetical protein